MERESFAFLYQDYFIIYFDILGYKAFFEKHNSTNEIQEYYEKITVGMEALINNIQQQNTYLSPYEDKFSYKIFSDNVCVFIRSRNDKFDLLKFMQIINLTSQIQRFFMFELGLLVRGGISKGKLCDNDKCIFGQGLIDAVTLEAIAAYPRICIPNASVIGDLYNISMNLAFQCRSEVDLIIHKLFLEIYNSLIEVDVQYFYLDYLKDFNIKQFLSDEIKDKLIAFSRESNNGMHDVLVASKDEEIVEYPELVVKLHHEKLLNMLSEYRDYHFNENNEKVLKKLIWILKYHNKVCEKAGLDKFHIKYHLQKDREKRIKKFKLKS